MNCVTFNKLKFILKWWTVTQLLFIIGLIIAYQLFGESFITETIVGVELAIAIITERAMTKAFEGGKNG